MVVFRAVAVVALAVATLVTLQLSQGGGSGGSAALAAPGAQLRDNGNENLSPRRTVPVAAGPESGTGVCAPAGQTTVIQSLDGRIAVRVFPTNTRAVRISITMVPSVSVAAVPGQRVSDLVFWLRGEYCEGGELATLPSAVNIGVHYRDADVVGLNEQSLIISRLSPTTNQWEQVASQAPDPSANYVSASTADLGVFAVHQR